MSALAEHAQNNYLTVRRALGFKLVGEGQLLAEWECHKVCVRRERMEPHAFNTRQENSFPASLL
jgi:hypothetical protein